MASKWKKKKPGKSGAAPVAAPPPEPELDLTTESPTGRRSWTPPGGHIPLPQSSSRRGSLESISRTVRPSTASPPSGSPVDDGLAALMASLQGVDQIRGGGPAQSVAHRAQSTVYSPIESDQSDPMDQTDDSETRRYLEDEFQDVSDESALDEAVRAHAEATASPEPVDDIILNPTREQLEDYAELIGLDLDADPDLEWIARQGLREPLPKGWRSVEDGDDVYYFNAATGASTWEHPCDEKFRAMYLKVKEEQKRAEPNKRPSELPASAANSSTDSYSEDFESASEAAEEQQGPPREPNAPRVTFAPGPVHAEPAAASHHNAPPQQDTAGPTHPTSTPWPPPYMPGSYTSLADRVGWAPFATMVDRDAAQLLQGHRAPSGFAWTDLLRTQLDFTRHYIEASRKLVNIAAQGGLEYQYTTLDETRQFIEQNQRDVITYEQALRQVESEQA